VKRLAAPIAIGLVLAAGSLGGCGSDPVDRGGVTASEAQQLNDAAAMLENDSVSANALVPEAGKEPTP
jgi:hypothetical protein